MANSCPWCGKPLEKKLVQDKDKIREICARCGYKIKEYNRPEQPKKVEEQPQVLEIRDTERPVVKQKPVWPWIIGGLVVILAIIFIVKYWIL
jgi:hypothetical protein